MSDVEQPRDRAQAAPLGLFGKHPAYGDFLRAGLPDAAIDPVMGWLDATLSALRDDLGNDWAGFWDGAQALRFWIGRGVFGHCMAGVLVPSRDRVGRRYPLVMMAAGVAQPAPVLDPAQGFYEALEAHLANAQPGAHPGQGAKALLDGLDLVVPAEDAREAGIGPTVWAHHPQGDLAGLLQAAGPVEAARAQLTRTMFWAPGRPGRAACWLADDRMPGPGALGWLLGGVPGAEEPQVSEGMRETGPETGPETEPERTGALPPIAMPRPSPPDPVPEPVPAPQTDDAAPQPIAAQDPEEAERHVP